MKKEDSSKEDTAGVEYAEGYTVGLKESVKVL